MLQEVLIFLVGLVLFFFGVMHLSESLQQILGVRARDYAKKITKKPIYGVGLGTFLAAAFQSSSAVTVMTVGIVSAGIISFYQSLGIIIGANVGTTIMPQLLSFKFTTIAPFLLVIGFVCWAFSKKSKNKKIGETVFYIGLLFFGFLLMSNATSPLKENQFFLTLLTKISSPLLGILAGLIFTAIVQASGLTIGLLVVLAQQGLIDLRMAIPILLGANMGTTLTAILAAFTSSKNAKKTAISHVLYNIIGVLIFIPFISPFTNIAALTSNDVARQIANAHTIFNVIVAIIFFFALPLWARLIEKIVPGQEKTLPLWPEYLDIKHIPKPRDALEATRKELRRELVIAQKMVDDSYKLTNSFQFSKLRDVYNTEIIVDNLQQEIAVYLDRVSRNKLKRDEAHLLLQYSAMVDDIERIADHAVNIAKLSRIKTEKKVCFSQKAIAELKEIYFLVEKNLNNTLALLTKVEKKKTAEIKKIEAEVDKKVIIAKREHAERFFKGICRAEAGPIYVDLLDNFERISDHCENIAGYFEQITEGEYW